MKASSFKNKIQWQGSQSSLSFKAFGCSIINHDKLCQTQLIRWRPYLLFDEAVKNPTAVET